MKPGNAGGAKGRRKVEVAMSLQREQQPALVPKAKQAGEPSARWVWCEPAVWTERMLTALETGVKGLLLQATWAVRTEGRPCLVPSILSKVTPPTGEPCAGDPHARFGGRGARTQSSLPTPIPW